MVVSNHADVQKRCAVSMNTQSILQKRHARSEIGLAYARKSSVSNLFPSYDHQSETEPSVWLVQLGSQTTNIEDSRRIAGVLRRVRNVENQLQVCT